MTVWSNMSLWVSDLICRYDCMIWYVVMTVWYNNGYHCIIWYVVMTVWSDMSLWLYDLICGYDCMIWCRSVVYTNKKSETGDNIVILQWKTMQRCFDVLVLKNDSVNKTILLCIFQCFTILFRRFVLFNYFFGHNILWSFILSNYQKG